MGREENDQGFDFGPFRLHSEIDLTELRLSRHSTGRPATLPVEIRLGRVDLKALGGSRVSEWVTAGPGVCGLAVPGLASFAVTGGNQVVVDAEPGADLADVRGYLTAWVFGALCHQNAMLPLHASAVERHGSATAFLGDSGAGKSTLAAFLGRRGYRVSSDDICLLRETGQGMGIVPVAEWLKLWRGTIEALGERVEPGNRTYSDEDKYRIYGAGPAGGAARGEGSPALRHLVFVERGEGPARLEELSSAATLGRMMGTIYLGYCMEAMGIGARVFAQCARVMEAAQGWALTAPWGFGEMPAVLDLLEQRVLGGETEKVKSVRKARKVEDAKFAK